MNNSCIFCNIINEQTDLIYQDDRTAAFLDVFPVEKGHILVVPKIHYDTWLATAPQDVAAVNVTAQKIAQKLLTIYPNQIKGFNIITNNGREAHQMVFHYHLHIIPKFNQATGFKTIHEPNIAAMEDLPETRKLLQAKLNN